EHRPAQFPGRLPDGIQASVIYAYERAVVVADGEAKGLPDFQSLRAPAGLHAQPPGCPVRESIALFGPGIPVDAADDAKALWRAVLEVVEVLLENGFAPA